MESCLCEYEVSNLAKEKNKHYAFQQTANICSVLSDSHKVILIVLKTGIPKGNPRQILTQSAKK